VMMNWTDKVLIVVKGVFRVWIADGKEGKGSES
jgi:hypothetical protein